jgi:predicted PurR-regulated permease PerM
MITLWLICVLFIVCGYLMYKSIQSEKIFSNINQFSGLLTQRITALESKKNFEKQDIDNWVNQQKEHARRLNKLENK